MARSGKGQKGHGQGPADDWNALISALSHRVRRRILRLLHTADRPRSPARIAEMLELPLSTVSYHVQVLAGFETVKEVKRQQVRSSIEHFYASMVEDNAMIQAVLEKTRKSDEDE